MSTWIDDAEWICRTVCPELAAVYVMPRAALDSRFDQAGGRCLAYTMPVLDVQLRPFLERQGCWAGRGFACVVYDDVPDPDRWPGGVEWYLVRTVLHELAHHLEPGQPLAAAPADADWGPLECWKAPRCVADEAFAGLPAWHGHGAAFIRASRCRA